MLALPLLLMLTLGYGLACPKECTCSQRSVDCSSTFLWDIPQNIPAEILSLDLTYNNLTTLPDDAFQSLSSLVTLLVHNSAVETVEPDAFHGLSVLGFLDLHNNYISYLHPGLFRHNTALSTLNLSGNRIHNMIGGIFSQNPVLTQVNFTGNPLDSAVNWLALGSFTSFSHWSKFCEPSDLLNHMFPTSMFDSLNLEIKEFKAIGVTNIIVYELSNMTWAVLETPVMFPVFCLCNELFKWILCGQEISSRTDCTTPCTISETFGNARCQYSDVQQSVTRVQPTKGAAQDSFATASPDVPSTSPAPNYKPYLTIDRNILVLSLAVAGVLVIIWTVAYLVFFHGKRKNRQKYRSSEVSSSSLPEGSPLSLPDTFAFNPAAAARHSATPDMLLTIRGGSEFNRDHILFSSLNTIESIPNFDAVNLYSEVEDRIDKCGKKKLKH